MKLALVILLLLLTGCEGEVIVDGGISEGWIWIDE